MHKKVNMVIVSCLEVMGIFSACRVYFKYFLTKINMSMCFGMLLDPNTLKCDIWSFCSESLIIERKCLGVRYRTPRPRVSASGTRSRDSGSRSPVPDAEPIQ